MVEATSHEPLFSIIETVGTDYNPKYLLYQTFVNMSGAIALSLNTDLHSLWPKESTKHYQKFFESDAESYYCIEKIMLYLVIRRS